ncbi:ankyrin repeat and SOCS box protein 2-like isoform X2 [Stegastes partitus]|uniref:Ankyrin repeat and SOCS box protein 2-like isoform X2 n=1 Tax=Stegastes partitus TaxID=144197 RepID=A0A9Y4KPF0_9TELE|nr:PREDICTED: ankyrin repeat and SOCS box protein 2-like isoform X2 [Stegastes partitus]
MCGIKRGYLCSVYCCCCISTAEPDYFCRKLRDNCILIGSFQRSNMDVSEPNLDDYSVYSQLSDEELLQIAVERSLIDKHSQPVPDQNSSSSLAPPTPADVTQTNPDPRQRHPQPSGQQHQVPPSQPPPAVQNSANPPTALSNFLYQTFKREMSPIQTVIINGDVEALMTLVRQKSSSLTELSDEGWIALHEAAYYGQLQCVRILIRAQPEFVNKRSSCSQTALMLAAERGHVSCVEFLLSHGADPNIANTSRETSLFTACEYPNEAIVELLLRSGAQVNRTSTQGGSALHEACRHGEVKICKMLLDAGADLKWKNIYDIQPFFTAAQHGHPDVVRLLARRGADINGQAGDGASPLYEACKNGHVSAVEALIALKADTNRATKSGLLPLHVAVQNNHIRIVSMLIPATSRVRVMRSGISPLHIAAEKNRDEIMELLIEHGFDVNTELSEEWSRLYEDRRTTALYFSVYNGNLEATEMLLEAGANPNIDIFNPLLIAVRLGWIDMAELLLRYGANANAEISTQPSSFPSAILLNMESLPMLKMLLDYGCNAQPCFDCPYGQKTHPPIPPSQRHDDRAHLRENSAPQHCILFCEAVSVSSFRRIYGPIISLLLDYVSHVRLCSRLLEVLESCSDWAPIKLKARKEQKQHRQFLLIH